MGFRRVALFLIATLAIVQALTAASICFVTRDTMVAQGAERLTVAAEIVARQIEATEADLGDRLELTLGAGLDAAVRARDAVAIRDTLRTRGPRLGAAFLLVAGQDGTISLDTRVDGASPGFPDPALLSAAASGRQTATVMTDGKLYAVVATASSSGQIVVAAAPLDAAAFERIRRLAGLPQTIALATQRDGTWEPIADASAGPVTATLVAMLPATPGAKPLLIAAGETSYLLYARPLAVVPSGSPVALALIIPTEPVLRHAEPILLVIGSLLAAGLAVALFGAMIIARSLSRPVEALAAAARLNNETLGAGTKSGVLDRPLAELIDAINRRDERIRQPVRHDPVTDLPDRTALIETVTLMLAQGPAALLVIGLTRQEETVRTVGREIADRLMHEAAKRLKAIAKDAPLARAGDDSFALLVPGLDRAAAVDLATEIVAAFEQPYQERYLALDATAAVGIALAPEHGEEAGPLLQHVDVALLNAVRAGTRIAVYDPGTDPRRPEHLSLMVDLRQALEHKELELVYQPKLDLALGRVTGVEALVRWRHEHRGNVPPDVFISLAEETGNIQRLTRWALSTGIGQASRWLSRGLAIRVSINLSVHDLADTDLPRRISSLLQAHRVPPDYLLLEVTESAIMNEPDAAIAVLKRIADQGVAISIDDFGVGHSSLAYLTKLPVRELKIDKSFVQNLVTSLDDQKIVHSVIELGHRLGFKVTAEGVEDADSLMGLKVMHCDYAQGYHIARPLSWEAMEHFFTDAPWPTARLARAG